MSLVKDASDLLGTVKDWPARYFFAAAFVAAGLLAASHAAWADAFGFRDAPPWFRLALTVTTLCCVAIGAVKGLTGVAESRAKRRTARDRGKAFEEEMHGLTPLEYAVFASFLDQDTKTTSFVDDTELGRMAHALAIRRYIYAISRERNAFFDQTTYVVQEPVFAFFRQNPNLLGDGRRLLREQTAQ